MAAERATLERRLANFRANLARPGSLDPAGPPACPPAPKGLAARLAETLGGDVIATPLGSFVRLEGRTEVLPVDRRRLAALPGQPPPSAPLVCLDTETTGLATAAGTLAFLVGLGWWEGVLFRQVQLLLPDHADEPALLTELGRLLPPDGWLVTYNGRGFDWPLLVARYRLARRNPPPLAGHLDLLPLVRRMFRHRLLDARLRTVESGVLGTPRHGDVDGWEIPGRYLDFLRGGSPAPLADVVRHNDEDVRSLGRLVAHVERGFGDHEALRAADPGDLAGLARAFARERRFGDALACLELALGRPQTAVPAAGRSGEDADPWWSPRRAPDYGGRPHREPPPDAAQVAVPWTEERLLNERARLLRRLGRDAEAAEAWAALAAGTTRLAAVAAVELAKVREHRLRDPRGALAAIERAWTILERRRRLGRPEPGLERDLVRRSARLRRRVARGPDRDQPVAGTSGTRGSGARSLHVPRTQSRSGSNEQAIVRRSPASALR